MGNASKTARVDDNLVKIGAAILFLKQNNVAPWNALQISGCPIDGSHIQQWGIADSKALRDCESWIDTKRTKAGKVLNDIGEAFTGRDEKTTNWSEYVFWYVPNWKAIAADLATQTATTPKKPRGAVTSDGARVMALGTIDEVRGRIIKDLHKFGQGDPWAENRSKGWAAFVGITTTVIGVILTCIPFTAAAGPFVIAGGAALAGVIAKSGDGLSVTELSEGVSQAATGVAAATAPTDGAPPSTLNKAATTTATGSSWFTKAPDGTDGDSVTMTSQGPSSMRTGPTTADANANAVAQQMAALLKPLSESDRTASLALVYVKVIKSKPQIAAAYSNAAAFAAGMLSKLRSLGLL